MTPKQRAALNDLAKHTADGSLYDQDDGPHHHQTLASLKRHKLARSIGAGLWRITLAGLVENRKKPTRIPYPRGNSNALTALETVKQHPKSTARDIHELTGMPIGSAENALRALRRRQLVKRSRGMGSLAYQYVARNA